MNNITATLSSEHINETFNPTSLIAIISSIGAVISIITGYLLKQHIQSSSCWSSKGCCQCYCLDGNEKEIIETQLQHYKSEKKKRESIVFEKEHSAISIV